MENKKAAILVLAVLAAVVVTASGVYAATGGHSTVPASYPGAEYGYGMGASMMGGYAGHGGMMGGYGMMGNGQYSMPQYMWQWWNSTSAP